MLGLHTAPTVKRPSSRRSQASWGCLSPRVTLLTPRWLRRAQVAPAWICQPSPSRLGQHPARTPGPILPSPSAAPEGGFSALGVRPPPLPHSRTFHHPAGLGQHCPPLPLARQPLTLSVRLGGFACSGHFIHMHSYAVCPFVTGFSLDSVFSRFAHLALAVRGPFMWLSNVLVFLHPPITGHLGGGFHLWLL